ncbi:MAG: hypothetical protein BRD25_01645 [Bacteroidetes bacterium QH_1_61_8]|nr:MAG: hypothetical protein BRD25_01645 [Bacteroidetes bacterium QH_1_61_8]
MSYRSHSRGIMYAAPPSGESENRTTATDESGDEPAAELDHEAAATEANWTVEADSSLYYLSTASGNREWTIDPSRWRVVRYKEKRRDGTVIENRHFSNFQMVDGVIIPHRVVFRRPPDNLMARIEYESIQLNPSNLTLDLQLPSKVPRRSFRGR